MIESWSQYQATFGGLISGVYLGYSVYQFFQNGGTQCWVIRIYEDGTTTPTYTGQTAAAYAAGTAAGLTVYASNPGEWGNGLCANVSNVASYTVGLTTYQTFNLQILLMNSNGTASLLESYTGLSTNPGDPNWAVNVVDAESNYVTLTQPPSGTPPTSLTIGSTGTSTTLWVVAGTLTTPSTPFTSADTANQAISTASAPVLGDFQVGNTYYLVFSGAVTGTPTPAGVWTGSSSGASFTPASTPIQLSGLPLQLATTPTVGAAGSQLTPGTAGNSGPFEFQLATAHGYALLGKLAFNLLCVPGETNAAVVQILEKFCSDNRAFLIVDPDQLANVQSGAPNLFNDGAPSDGATFYFPWVSAPDPLSNNRPTLFPPCGFVAGIYAATDATRGVWKAPAGTETGLTGVFGLQYLLADSDSGLLNPIAVNCLRQFPAFGTVVWGARTIAGSDAAGSQWEYVPIRRFALFLESSLYEGTQWAVFEPNAEPTWSQIRLSIGSFMQQLFLQGAFAGSSPQQAYFVKCDADNNPPASVALGVLNVTVGFAPLYPAEFIVIQIQQMIQS
jgi:hypothetical protein